MRAFRSLRNRLGKRGFTLVELMIVVAIIGVLAALAIYGVRRYLASSKTSEAKQTIGGISRGATGAFEREYSASEALGEGAESTEAAHSLCDSATPVPAAGVPKGRKYQPKTTDGDDFQGGDRTAGWQCLNFSLNQPHYYQYHYYKGMGTSAASSNPAACASADCYEAAAVGDLDGDSSFSRFARTGTVNTASGKLKAATQIYIENEFE